MENHYGKGQTLLIGTFPGAGYSLHHSIGGKAFFASLLKSAGVEPHLRPDTATVQARLHAGTGGNYLWAVYPSRRQASERVSLADGFPAIRSAKDRWSNLPVTSGDRKKTVSIPARDAAVISRFHRCAFPFSAAPRRNLNPKGNAHDATITGLSRPHHWLVASG